MSNQSTERKNRKVSFRVQGSMVRDMETLHVILGMPKSTLIRWALSLVMTWYLTNQFTGPITFPPFREAIPAPTAKERDGGFLKKLKSIFSAKQ